MKFGEQLEWQSVPEWALHNVDYNSLKREIKVHTSRDQARAIAIPGQEDTRLKRFENAFFIELCRQHERVDLFVKSKADEVGRRLDHLASKIALFVQRRGREARTTSKTQRRFVRLERELLRCGDDLAALRRFIRAQMTAFRKIIKKYRKWTASATLGARFHDDIKSDPKAFSRLDFSVTQTRYDELKAILRAAAPETSEPSSPDSECCRDGAEAIAGAGPSSATLVKAADDERFALPPPGHEQQQQRFGGYWNEYDYGSDGNGNGDDDGGYAIYVHPGDDDYDDGDGFPGFGYVRDMAAAPFVLARAWFSRPPDSHGGGERAPLLPQATTTTPAATNGSGRNGNIGGGGGGGGGPGYLATSRSYLSQRWGGDSDDDDDALSSASSTDHERRRFFLQSSSLSSSPFPPGYEPRYAALPSINEQRVARYRERVYFWASAACFAGSLVLTAIAGVLLSAGRNKARLEVEAGVTVGIISSVLAAWGGLGLFLLRRDPLSAWHRVAVWTVFLTTCFLNIMLLILVMER